MAQYFRETLHRLVVGVTRKPDFPPHLHEELELIYMRRGSCTAFCSDKQYDLVQGDFFLAFPEQVHHYYESKDCEAILVILNPGQIIRKGERHPHLYLVQGMLAVLAESYRSIAAPAMTGLLDNATSDAIASFQMLSGLPMTGHLDKHTWKQLALQYPLAANLAVSGIG